MAMPAPASITRGSAQPIARPALRWRPLRDSGIPIFRDSRLWAWETPRARRQEKDRPGMPVPRLRAILSPGNGRILLSSVAS